MDHSWLELSGRRILVTGAAGGIGLAIAKTLVDAGARVAITDIDHDALQDAANEAGAEVALVADITSEKEVETLFTTTAAALGGLDGLVNNAGLAEPLRATRKQTLNVWRKVLDVNLQGTFLMCRQAACDMKTGGAVVNIASIAGLCAFAASNAYGVSKAATIMLTKSVALDLAKSGIRVNAVAPGMVDAPMTAQMSGDNPVFRDALLRRIPIGRLAQCHEIANAVAFLLSDKSSYITGTILAVDGGWSAFGGAGDASSGPSN